MDTQRADQLDEYLSALTALRQFNGNVLIAQQGKLLFQKAYGRAHQQPERANQLESRFFIGSLSKQFTAFALLKLAQEQQLSLQAPLTQFYPAFSEEISLQHLLEHRSGLAANETREVPEISLKELISNTAQSELLFQPGTDFLYSNLGYAILAGVIEQVTGLDFGSALKQLIFAPLKMQNTGHGLKPDHSFATGYQLSQEGYLADPITEMTHLYGAGSLASTLGDLWLWSRELGGQSENAPHLASVFEILRNPKQKYHYGLWHDHENGQTLLSHTGLIHSFRSYFLYFLESKLCLIILSNVSPTPLMQLKQDLLAIVRGQDYTLPKVIKRHSIRLSQSLLEKYVGIYQMVSDPDQVLEIVCEQGQVLQIDTAKNKTPLFAETADVFFVDAKSPESLKFQTDTSGKVIGLEYLTAEGWSAQLRKKTNRVS